MRHDDGSYQPPAIVFAGGIFLQLLA